MSLLLLFSCCGLHVSGQQKTKIILQSFEKSRIITKTDITYLRKPVFRQDNAILTCDSAVFYTAKNYFEAYENVHINQADTINIYSDRLTYDGNSKVAHLSSNVRLLDKSSTLTTNILDYNMVPKVGTYVNGGKIVNKEAVITSKNGYYFANTRDAYFRYNVLVVTEQSTIKSDTLRYNTLTNWAYFYGPTNIKEKDGNLYTENGAYNTKTTYAYFGKNNLYTSGSRSLKGDSLYYDGIAGYGKAVRNIVFKDTVDKMLMHGQLGYYYKKDQRTLVTKNAYVGMGTNDSVMVKTVKRPDSLWLGADTLETQMVLQKSLKLIRGPVVKKDNELGEEVRETKLGIKGAAETAPAGNHRPAAGEKPGGQAGRPPAKEGTPPPAGAPAAGKPAAAGVKEPPVKTAEKDTLVKKPLPPPVAARDSLNQKKQDSLPRKTVPGVKKGAAPFNPLDTVMTRSIKAYRHVQVYKTNMQARADSLFYTSADSTLRWYRNPIIWAQGSQLTGDTIYVQLRNKKVNSVQVIQTGFAVNVDTDSAKYNQVKGKLITGFFKDGNLSSMYVDGNAESVYFTKTDDGKHYDKMNQTVSSRIKILFRNNEIGDVVPIKDVEGATTPVADLKKEVILTGFIWKPELKPRSKRDITNPRPAAKAKPAAAKKTDKPAARQLLPAAGQLKKGIPSGVTDSAAKALPGLLKLKQSIPKGITDSAAKALPELLKLKQSIPKDITDSAAKALPGLLQQADSLTRQPVLLKKQ